MCKRSSSPRTAAGAGPGLLVCGLELFGGKSFLYPYPGPVNVWRRAAPFGVFQVPHLAGGFNISLRWFKPPPVGRWLALCP